MSQLGRISGQLLKDNLTRNGHDLTFDNDLLHLDVNNRKIGIKTVSPETELDVNGTTRTTDLEVTTQADIADLTILGNTITSNNGILNLSNGAGDHVTYQAKLIVDNVEIENNVISTNGTNTNLEIRPNGTGTVDIYADTNVYGNIYATGNIRADGNITVGDANTDNITINADVASNIIPDIHNFYTLGNIDYRWADLWVNNVFADSLTTEDLVVDGINLNLRPGKLYYVSTNGDNAKSGTHQNDPFLTVKHALSVAASGDTVYIYPGTYTEIFPLTVPVGVTVRGAGIRAVKIVPTVGTNTQDAFLLNGETTVEDITIADFYSPGYAFKFATGFTVTSRSPYVRNITVLTKGSTITLSDPLGYASADAGKGAFIDGSTATAISKEASMLFNAVTFICPGVDAVVATNGARIEWLNSFSYFANKGMYLYSSSAGFAGDGKTRVKITNKTGTWSVGNTLSYYDTDGTTVLASGVIESIDGDFYNIDGRVLGFEIPSDRAGKTITVHGDAELSTAQVKFGTASLALDGVGDFISLASQPDFAYGTGAFTIEMWVYRTVSGVVQILLDQRTASPTNYAPFIFIGTTNVITYSDGAATVITGATTVPLNAWSHVALSRSGTSTRLFLDGVQQGTTYTDTRNYIASPVSIGIRFDGIGSPFTGYIDDVRISKGVARYTTTFSVPTAQLTGDASTVLLITCNGLNGSTAIVDNGITFQDLRTSAGGTASVIDVADYSDFGAEVRSIGSASVYGEYGIYGDGPGVIGYFIGQNLAYIGNGKESSNDPNTVIQANEVVELNDAKIYYQSVDHKGDFRVGDLFYVNQQTGEVSFSNSNVTIGTNLIFDDGLGNITFIDASKIETGDFRISDNTIETLSQDFNILAASGLINLQSNVTISGNLGVTGDVTVGGNVTIGDQSTDTVSFVAGVDSNIVPNLDSTYSLGTTSERWLNLYSTQVIVSDIQIDTNTITTLGTNTNLVLSATGTGKVYVPSNDVQIDQDLTVLGTSYLANTTIVGDINHTGDVDQTGNVEQTGDIEITGTLTVDSIVQFTDINITDNIITTTIGNNNLQLEAAGTGKIIIPSNDVDVTGALTVTGITNTSSIDNTGTITSDTFTTGDISIATNSIVTTLTNSNLVLEADGTGIISIPTSDVTIDQKLTVVGLTTLAETEITGLLTHVGDLDQTGDTTHTGNYILNGNLTVDSIVQFTDINITDNIITTTIGNNDLQLEAAGTGKIIVPNNDVDVTGTLTVIGVTYSTTINNTGTVTSDTFTTGDISIATNSIVTTLTNSNLVLTANGTGIISIPSNNVEITNNLTVDGDTTLANTTIVGDVIHTGDVEQTGNVLQTGDLTITGTLDIGSIVQFENIQINDNVITTTVTNDNLILSANGTGVISVPDNNVTVSQNLTVTGNTNTSNIDNTGTITSGIFNTSSIEISSNSIGVFAPNLSLTLSANGTGIVSVPTSPVVIDNTLTVNSTTTLEDVNLTGTLLHVGNTTRTGDVEQTGNYTLNGNLTVTEIAQFKDVNITDNTITTTVTNNNLILSANGTGIVSIPTNNVSIANDLTVLGTTFTANIENTGTVTANTFSTGNITISGNIIQTTSTNSNLQLSAAGTGFIELEQFDVQENELRINSGTDMILSPNGTGIVDINSTQSIRVPVGDNADRPASPSAGMIRFNTELSRYEGFDGSFWIQLSGVIDVDGNTFISAELTPGANDNTIRFVTNGSEVADLTSARLNVINVDVDSININNNTISTTTTNTDLIISPNGTGALRIGNFAFRSNVITNTVNNSVTLFNQSGDGYVKINSTGGFVIPVGATGTRPGIVEVGMMRFNTTDQRVEIWDGANWVGAGQGAGGGVTAAEAQDIGIVSAIIFG
jgi:hypothetical protein